jgi:hypothetical protein
LAKAHHQAGAKTNANAPRRIEYSAMLKIVAMWKLWFCSAVLGDPGYWNP